MKLIKKIIINSNMIIDYICNEVSIKVFKVKKGKNVEINGKIFIRNNGEINIGNGVIINSKYSANPIGGQSFTSLFVKEQAKIIIKDGAGISNTAICAFKSVSIGEDVYIGGGCRIYDTDFHSINYNDRTGILDKNIKSEAIDIKKGCFIGANTIILKGVTIGEYSVVGAGSVVTKNIPENEIWAGNPAKFIRNL